MEGGGREVKTGEDHERTVHLLLFNRDKCTKADEAISVYFSLLAATSGCIWTSDLCTLLFFCASFKSFIRKASFVYN